MLTYSEVLVYRSGPRVCISRQLIWYVPVPYSSLSMLQYSLLATRSSILLGVTSRGYCTESLTPRLPVRSEHDAHHAPRFKKWTLFLLWNLSSNGPMIYWRANMLQVVANSLLGDVEIEHTCRSKNLGYPKEAFDR
jgi:hypothetical protein